MTCSPPHTHAGSVVGSLLGSHVCLFVVARFSHDTLTDAQRTRLDKERARLQMHQEAQPSTSLLGTPRTTAALLPTPTSMEMSAPGAVSSVSADHAAPGVGSEEAGGAATAGPTPLPPPVEAAAVAPAPAVEPAAIAPAATTAAAAASTTTMAVDVEALMGLGVV